MKTLITTIALLCTSLSAMAQVHIHECYELAKRNYPLVKQYDIINNSADFTVSNAKKAYLPQISLSAQATYQSDVPTFSGELDKMMQSMGVQMDGLHKDQYKTAVNINQFIWDGGNLKAQKLNAEADRNVEMSKLDVDLYGLNSRINDLFFGSLIIEEQLKQNYLLNARIASNMEELEALIKSGVAIESDLDALKAEQLTVKQQEIRIKSAKQSYRAVLAIFTGVDSMTTATFVKPNMDQLVEQEVKRPELNLFDAQRNNIETQRKQLNTILNPKITAFAEGFYGNPGLDMFADMMKYKWGLNYIAGVKLQWNISGFYTKKNSHNLLNLAQSKVDIQKETFLFNTKMQSAAEREAVTKMRMVIEHDNEIIKLRTSILETAEAKMEAGVIDVTELISHIIAQSNAKVAKEANEIELLKNIYELKTTLNQ